MSMTMVAEAVPLSKHADGVLRVGNTRVTLDTVVYAFCDGATPEEIAQQYPALQLADVYAVLAYYLKRKAEVEAYFRDRDAEAGKVRQENEVRFDPDGVRDRLLARRARQE